MITISKKDYEVYLTNLIFAAVKEVEASTRPVIIPVHCDKDLLKINLMLNELIFQYPETINITVEKLTTH